MRPGRSSFAEADADRLEQQGAQPLPVGRELAPSKRLYFVTSEQLDALAVREVPVRLTAEFLQATAIALLPHAGAEAQKRPAGSSEEP